MRKLAVRLDGNRHIGLGHMFRCLHLAEHLKQNHNCEIVFFLLESSLDSGILEFCDSSGVKVVPVSLPGSPWVEDTLGFERALKGGSFDAVLVDLVCPDPQDDDLNDNSDYCPADILGCVQRVKALGLPVFALSDRFDHVDIPADLVINSCPAQQGQWYAGSRTKFLLGPKYYLLPNSFRNLSRCQKTFLSEKPHVVIFCGGNDHRGFTSMLLDCLLSHAKSLSFEVVLGAATPDIDLRAEEYRAQGVDCRFKVKDMAPVLFNADCVISTSGNTLFDLAALGVPAAAVSTRERQRITARFFSDAGCCVDLGMEFEEIAVNLKLFVNTVLHSPKQLLEMSRRGRESVDGDGLVRVAEEMVLVFESVQKR
ncbi:MAG: hypothetical protein JEY79_05780 [Pseudodesulfovibrio sp.]|nr:hypothetical protein [Pseudodesulfovibrio sp.]